MMYTGYSIVTPDIVLPVERGEHDGHDDWVVFFYE